jgi:hypothetical protein
MDMDELFVLRQGETLYFSNADIETQFLDLLVKMVNGELASFTLRNDDMKEMMQVACIKTPGGPVPGFWSFDYSGQKSSGIYMNTIGESKWISAAINEFSRTAAFSTKFSMRMVFTAI